MHDVSLNDSFWLCISELQLIQYFFQIIFLVKEIQRLYAISCHVLKEGLRVKEYVCIYEGGEGEYLQSH